MLNRSLFRLSTKLFYLNDRLRLLVNIIRGPLYRPGPPDAPRKHFHSTHFRKSPAIPSFAHVHPNYRLGRRKHTRPRGATRHMLTMIRTGLAFALFVVFHLSHSCLALTRDFYEACRKGGPEGYPPGPVRPWPGRDRKSTLEHGISANEDAKCDETVPSWCGGIFVVDCRY